MGTSHPPGRKRREDLKNDLKRKEDIHGALHLHLSIARFKRAAQDTPEENLIKEKRK